MKKYYPAIIIGGGQAGLSVAYYLKRLKIDFVIIDDKPTPGGSWRNTWPSLKLFSPAEYSSLSGWQMPPTKEEYPHIDELIDYLTRYEKRYQFEVLRPFHVNNVKYDNETFTIKSDKLELTTDNLIVATGTASGFYIPKYKGYESYQGKAIHSIDYRGPEPYKSKDVLIVGAGNTGAQITAELVDVASVTWVSKTTPEYLDASLDGRYLFNTSNEIFRNNSDTQEDSKKDFHKIVQVESVRDALLAGKMNSKIANFTFYKDGVVWENGEKQKIDSVIWCTGFKQKLSFLDELKIIENSKIQTEGTRSSKIKNLWLVGMGDWTGYASATIYGVGKTARTTAEQVFESLEK